MSNELKNSLGVYHEHGTPGFMIKIPMFVVYYVFSHRCLFLETLTMLSLKREAEFFISRMSVFFGKMELDKERRVIFLSTIFFIT